MKLSLATSLLSVALQTISASHHAEVEQDPHAAADVNENSSNDATFPNLDRDRIVKESSSGSWL